MHFDTCVQYVTIPRETSLIYSILCMSPIETNLHHLCLYPLSQSFAVSFFKSELWILSVRTCASNGSRHSGGKQTTSARLNAVCEVSCVNDLSGPRSLFGISIYRHLFSPNHPGVPPHPLPSLPLFAHFIRTHTHMHTDIVLTCDDSMSSESKLKEALFIRFLLFS